MQYTGTVKIFNETQGFGFIITQHGDVFFETTGVIDGLRPTEGSTVTFEVEDGKKGPSAVNISKVGINTNPPDKRSFYLNFPAHGEVDVPVPIDQLVPLDDYGKYAKELTLIPIVKREQIISRENELANLEKIFKENRMIVISGLGGSGKTTLCTLFVRKNIENFNHIVWLNCRDGVYNSILYNSYLNANLYISNSLSNNLKVKNIIDILNEIIGNNIIILDEIHEDIADFCSKLRNNWSVIATSRKKIDGFFTYNIETLSFDAAQTLFYSFYNKDENNSIVKEILNHVKNNIFLIELLGRIGQEENIDLVNLAEFAKVDTIKYILDNISLSKNEVNYLIIMSILPRKEHKLVEVGYIFENLFKEVSDTSVIITLTKKGLLFQEEQQRIKIHPLIGHYVLDKYAPRIDIQDDQKKQKKQTLNYLKMIAEGKIQDCIEELLDVLKYEKQNFYNQIILISSRFNTLKDHIIKGIVASADSILLANQIANSILILIHEMDAEDLSKYINSEIKKDSIVKVFFSYSRKDIELRDEIQKQLSILQRNKLIETWYDLDMRAGKEWEKEIMNNLHSSDIILILVSADYLHSDYCFKELEMAIELHNKNKIIVIPIILKDCLWRETVISKLSVIPTGAKPLTNWDNRDEVLADIALKIKERVLEISQKNGYDS